MWWIPVIVAFTVAGCLSQDEDPAPSGDCDCKAPVNTEPPRWSQTPENNLQRRGPFWNNTDQTDVFLRYVNSSQPRYSARAQSELLPSIYGQSRACIDFLNRNFGFQAAYPNVKMTVQHGVAQPDNNDLNFSPYFVGFDSFGEFALPTDHCENPAVVNQMARFMLQDSLYASLSFSFNSPREFTDFYNSPASILMTGLSIYLASRTPVFRYPHPVENALNLREIREQTLNFSACMRGERLSECDTTQARFDSFACCSAHYEGLRTMLSIRRNEMPIEVAARLYLVGSAQSEGLFVSIDGANPPLRFNMEVSSDKTSFASLPEGDVQNTTAIGTAAFRSTIPSATLPLERGSLLLFGGYAARQVRLACGDSGFRETLSLALADGSRLTQYDRTGLYSSLGGFDTEDTAACFWSHLESTYGHDAFVRLMRRFQSPNTFQACGTQIDIIQIFSESLNIPRSQVESDMALFRIQPNFLRRVELLPLCR